MARIIWKYTHLLSFLLCGFLLEQTQLVSKDCVCVGGGYAECVYVEVRRQNVGVGPLPPPWGFQGLTLGYQAWQQALVPAEPSCHPLAVFCGFMKEQQVTLLELDL